MLNGEIPLELAQEMQQVFYVVLDRKNGHILKVFTSWNAAIDYSIDSKGFVYNIGSRNCPLDVKTFFNR